VSANPPVQVPAYAWSWLQRSRPVLAAAAQRLTGGPPDSGFLEQLRASYLADPFTRAVLADVIAEVAFGGRVPTSRPAGMSWDRGLTWWASVLSGVPADRFDVPSPQGAQRRLFDDGTAEREPSPPAAPAHAPPISRERRALAEALRDLIRTSGESVPASALRQLADTLDPHTSG
jgi:hypothetical protein